MADRIDRRRFLKVLGATGSGAAALSGCATDHAEQLIPYLVPPENQIPGMATWYATTCRECPAGCGMHVRVREGRAVKVEGNPDSPVNRGRLCARAQSSLQRLYHPDRVRSPLTRTANGEFEPITWDEAITQIGDRLVGVAGDRVWFLSGEEAGTFDRLLTEFMGALGSRGRVVFEPFGYEALRHASREVFGIDALPRHDFASARYVISFGADFLETWLSPVEYTQAFASSHAYRDGSMGRFVHVEPRMSMTAMNADEWIAPVAGSEGALALAMAHVIVTERLGRSPPGAAPLRSLLERSTPAVASEQSGVRVETIERLAREFSEGPSLAVAGGMGAQHPDAHATAAAVHILNYVAGNVGRTVTFPGGSAGGGNGYARLAQMVEAMAAGQVDVLFIHGANPAHATPGGLSFNAAMEQVGLKVSFARTLDETAVQADLILPDHDPFEQWNDFEPRSGLHLLQQPVMRPVFDTRQTGDILLDVARRVGGPAGTRLSAASYKDYVQDSWQGIQRRVGDRRPFETFWNEAVQNGGVSSEGWQQSVRLAASAARLEVTPWSVPEGQYTLIAYPSPVFYDGRGADRPWLQELPDPVTKVTWGSWVEINPKTARALGVAEGDVVRVESASGSVSLPAYLHPGIRENVVAIPIGQGHTAFGRYASGVGTNAYDLLPGEATAFGGVAHYAAVTLHADGGYQPVAKTEGSRRQLGRGIADAVTLAALAGGEAGEHHAAHAAPVPESHERVLEEWAEMQHHDTERGNYAGDHPRWGMAIDLSRCTGCSACVTACHAENNIPHVGADQVRRGREMSWIRIERYFEGGGEEPLEARFLPMLCQQCGNAPCEPVCPVFAAYHTPDGLNAQVYNRCVGTRYCSNNCPYKVRYFNWYDTQNPADEAFAWPDPMHWLLNPDVTVRSKGVMEKCTFCVQRIRGAQHDARMSDRPLRDGDILTACQQTCPADAIAFGDLNDPNSRVSALSRQEHGYHVLDGLNTKPAVTYLKKVRNLAEA